MITYNYVLGVLISADDIDELKNYCTKHDLEFEDDMVELHNRPRWQEHYKKLTGLSGIIKRCYVSIKTTDRGGLDKLIDILENSNLDIFINIEVS